MAQTEEELMNYVNVQAEQLYDSFVARAKELDAPGLCVLMVIGCLVDDLCEFSKKPLESLLRDVRASALEAHRSRAAAEQEPS